MARLDKVEQDIDSCKKEVRDYGSKVLERLAFFEGRETERNAQLGRFKVWGAVAVPVLLAMGGFLGSLFH